MTEKVSIIIPVYNNERFIGKCMETVIQQSYSDIEIIVINDGSTDKSGKIVEEFAQKDSRVRLINQENKGVSAARNRGIVEATGEYITFVDGDDYIAREYIYNLVRCATDNHAQMVISGVTMVDTEQKVLKEIIPGNYVRYEHEEWTFRLTVTAAHLYKRSLWDKYKISFFEGVRGEDIPIALFFAGVCERICTIPRAEYYYVQHAQSAMHNFRGLKTSRLPYIALEDAICRIRKVGLKNSPEFHELFVLRVLATFIDLTRGAGKDNVVKLGNYINHILDVYYPEYYKNRKTRIFTDLDIPLFQRASVKFLIWSKRLGILTFFLRVVCR